MLLWKRPKPPLGFGRRAKPLRRTVRLQVASGRKPDFSPALWRDYKDQFSGAQERKCAFCEVLETTYVGAVEHLRPKGSLEALSADRATWGTENPQTSNVEGRRPESLSETGYWWLAYSWSNWLFACERCNTAWKKAIFPLLAGSQRWNQPWPRVREQALVLDPYGKADPALHLTFDSLGQIEAVAGSDMGFETIRTLGLDRESLRKKRFEKVQRAYRTISRLHQAHTEDEIRTCCADLVEMGRKEYEHAGMVRILVRQKLDISWEVLEMEFGRDSDRAPGT